MTVLQTLEGIYSRLQIKLSINQYPVRSVSSDNTPIQNVCVLPPISRGNFQIARAIANARASWRDCETETHLRATARSCDLRRPCTVDGLFRRERRRPSFLYKTHDHLEVHVVVAPRRRCSLARSRFFPFQHFKVPRSRESAEVFCVERRGRGRVVRARVRFRFSKKGVKTWERRRFSSGLSVSATRVWFSRFLFLKKTLFKHLHMCDNLWIYYKHVEELIAQ